MESLVEMVMIVRIPYTEEFSLKKR